MHKLLFTGVSVGTTLVTYAAFASKIIGNG